MLGVKMQDNNQLGNDKYVKSLHEKKLFENFIVPSKRKKMIEFISMPAKRRKILSKLSHFDDLDKRYSFKIPNDRQTFKQIFDLLKANGAPDYCYIISTDKSIDGKFIKLSQALETVIGCSNGVFISCVPGSLGYYEGEARGERYILKR
jgi:hypothetical protein